MPIGFSNVEVICDINQRSFSELMEEKYDVMGLKRIRVRETIGK